MARPAAEIALLQRLPHTDPVEAVQGLDALHERLPSMGDPQRLRALAQALPREIATLDPNVAMALHGVASALVEHEPRIPTDLAKLEPWLRVQWLRMAISAGSELAESLLDDTTLRHVVHEWSLDRVLSPKRLIERLCTAEDPRLRREGLQRLRPAVERLAIGTDDALTRLLALARDERAELRRPAIEMLGEGWLGEPPPAAARARDAIVLEALNDVDPAVAKAAACAIAGQVGAHRDALWERLVDRQAPLELRVTILDRLGPGAQDEELPLVLEIAAEEPLGLGPAVRRFLLAAHRHGVFLRARHLDALLVHFDVHRGWTSEQLCRVTHIVRHELIEALRALSPDDERWVRRAGLLAQSLSPAAPGLIAEVLRQTSATEVAVAMLGAAGRNPDFDDEAALLRWLPTLPEVVVGVLGVKGGDNAASALLDLIEQPLTPPELRAQALPALWAVTRQRATLPLRLSAALGPHDSGLLRATFLPSRDGTVAELVAEAPWPAIDAHRLDRLARLDALCGSGDDRFMPTVEALLREQFREYVAQALAGDFSIKRFAMPQLEQKIFRYGRHLVAAGRHVRRFIDRAPQTGRDLVLRMACDWLAQEPSVSITVALLETIGRQKPDRAALRTIMPLWRHGHREVQRAAIETILLADRGARGLELSLCRLVEHDEPRIVTQALGAVASYEARWAEPLALAALSHPHMGVKKAAAQALAVVASAQAVPTLLGWLAHHDNPGFRGGLVSALERAAGPSLVAVVVAAIERETESRRVELLCRVLSGRLPLAAALRLARSSLPIHAELVERCLAGSLRLSDHGPATLARRLHRASLRPKATRPDDPTARLRIEGFSVEAATQLVGRRNAENEAEVRTVVRAGLADWITWLKAVDPIPADALAVVLDAAQELSDEHADALLDLVERVEAPDSDATAKFIERNLVAASVAPHRKLRAVRMVRALPVSPALGGRRRYDLLGHLGAVRSEEDLWQSLEHCRVRPQAREEIAALVSHALKVPARAKREAAALTELRQQCSEFFGWPIERRREWLSGVLRTRPLGLPPDDRIEPARPRRPRLRSADRRQQLLAELDAESRADRDRAAAELMDWSDVADDRPRVLAAFLGGHVTLSAAHRRALAPLLAKWPTEAGARERAATLLPDVPVRGRAALVSSWLQAWESGAAPVEPELIRLCRSPLAEIALARANNGDPGLLHLLGPSNSLATRTIIEALEQRYPEQVESLRYRPPDDEAPAADSDPDDPLAGRDLEGLAALIKEKGVDKGLAVRAVHALADHGERAIAPLAQLVTDRRPPVRSAALRALRKVAPREVTLPATARALAMESRKDVIGQLMKSLGHGKYEPALSTMLDYLGHRELSVRDTAREAIVAYGPDIVPTLRRLARRARPDRRRAIEAVVARLETVPGGEG